VEENVEKAHTANLAASAIRYAVSKTLHDMAPAFAVQYDLDEQLVILAIAQAALGVAVIATSEATGMASDDVIVLEDRLHGVVFDAMNELLND
jgi:hypothetical protein